MTTRDTGSSMYIPSHFTQAMASRTTHLFTLFTRSTTTVAPETTLSWLDETDATPSANYPDSKWGDFNFSVPVVICGLVVLLMIMFLIIAKKRRGRLRAEGRQHPSRVMSGGPAMSVDAYRRYPGTVPHRQVSQAQGRQNEVTLVVDPPTYPGPRELPPSYDEVMRMYPSQQQMLGTQNLGFSGSDSVADPPGGSTSQAPPDAVNGPPVNLHGETSQNVNSASNNSQCNYNEQTGSSQQSNNNEQSNNITNAAEDSSNSGSVNTSQQEKPEPQICAEDREPKPD